MPQQLSAAQSHRAIQVAQQGVGPQIAPLRARAAVAAPEAAENPLAEHPALYYSGVGVLVVLIMLGFAGFCRSKGLVDRSPSKRQSLLEQAVESITWFARNAIGPGGEKFAPLIGTVFAFVLVSNLMGVLPLSLVHSGAQYGSITPAPTSNLSMTLAVSLIVFVVVQYVGIKENGVGGYLKHFAGPIPILAPLIFPLEIIGAIAKPISLSIRLFGNIFGEETVTAVLIGLALTTLPRWLPIPYQFPMLCFSVFGAIVQAGVYTILTCAYISLSIGEHDSNGHHHMEDEFGVDFPAQNAIVHH